MARLPRFGAAISAVALASMIGGCAAPMSRSSSAKAGNANLAYGLRAQMALSAGDYVSAVDLAEKAAESSPGDAAVRALLGNSYFASGRFASAESAYNDALSLAGHQSDVVLKLALVQIAQGKNGEAIALLQSTRGLIEAADLGLALALAGQPGEAVQVLESAARSQGADSRVRQNLALAHALSGDWSAARIVAAQDLSPALVDSRIEQWMALSKPSRPSDQVAALVGVSPAVADPGQPTRLALNQTGTQVAQAAQTAPIAEQAAVQAQGPAFATPVVAPVAIATAEAPTPAPVAEPAAAPQPPAAIAAAAAIAPEAPAAFAVMASSFAPEAKPASAPKKPAPVRKAAASKADGNSKAVVQLGAYSSAERVSTAWAQLAKRYPALRDYTPVRARFDGPRGTVWRLSIKGFDNQQEAIARCQVLRNRGGNCFVRPTAGDAPVQLASR